MELTSLPSFGETIRRALWLDESIYLAVQHAPNGIWYALAVVILASLSESVGQSVVLFLNRIRPKRFVLALGISTVSHMVGFLLWTMVVWLVGTVVFDSSQSIVVIASAVGLAYAPQLLAFFELTPFLGNPFSVILTLWSTLAIVIGVRVGLDLETWQAVVASGLGWSLIQVWRRTLGRPIYGLGGWLQRRAAGAPLSVRARDVAGLRRPPRLAGRWEEQQAGRQLGEPAQGLAGGDETNACHPG